MLVQSGNTKTDTKCLEVCGFKSLCTPLAGLSIHYLPTFKFWTNRGETGHQDSLLPSLIYSILQTMMISTKVHVPIGFSICLFWCYSEIHVVTYIVFEKVMFASSMIVEVSITVCFGPHISTGYESVF